jgi:hypothetical protein
VGALRDGLWPVNGLFEAGGAGTAATWVAAIVTLAVWSYVLGERRILHLAQLLLAGLATGYLALLAIREVLIPQLIVPLATDPRGHLELVGDLLLALPLLVWRWFPRRIVAVPAAIVVGATAGYALGGAVVGTLLPQLATGIVSPGAGAAGITGGVIGLVITLPVLVAFVQGTNRGAMLGGLARAGRWLLVGGLGAWLGFLLVSRLALLVDRVGFLLGDWLGVVR